MQQNGGPGSRPLYTFPGAVNIMIQTYAIALRNVLSTDRAELSAARNRRCGDALAARLRIAMALAGDAAASTERAPTPRALLSSADTTPSATARLSSMHAAPGTSLPAAARETADAVLSSLAPGAFERLVSICDKYNTAHHRGLAVGPLVKGGVGATGVRDTSLARRGGAGGLRAEIVFLDWKTVFEALLWAADQKLYVCKPSDAPAVLAALDGAASAATASSSSTSQPRVPAAARVVVSRHAALIDAKLAAASAADFISATAGASPAAAPPPPLPRATLLAGNILPPLSGYRGSMVSADCAERGVSLTGATADQVLEEFRVSPIALEVFQGNPLSRPPIKLGAGSRVASVKSQKFAERAVGGAMAAASGAAWARLGGEPAASTDGRGKRVRTASLRLRDA